jgi:hypothetical protein
MPKCRLILQMLVAYVLLHPGAAADVVAAAAAAAAASLKLTWCMTNTAMPSLTCARPDAGALPCS